MGDNNFIVAVDKTEFNKRIMDCISSDEIDKFINNTVFKDDPKCKSAVIHGMCIAAMLMTDCNNMILQ